MSVNINCVVLIGRLTKDPEVHGRRCTLRLAVNERRKVKAPDGEEAWVDRPGYFDVVTWGPLAQTCAAHLVRGRLVAVSGALSFHEWAGETEDAPRRRRVEVVASTVSFLDAPPPAAAPTRAVPVPVPVLATAAPPEPEPAAA